MTPDDAAPTPAPAPFLLRGVARGVDMGVQVAVMEGAFRVSGVLPVTGLVPIPDDLLLAVDITIGCLALLLYTAVAEWLGGATLGKALTGLRICSVDAPDAPVRWKPCLIRNLAFFIDGLFFGMVAYSHMANNLRRQRLGDEWAGTMVVWKSDAPPRSAVRGWAVGAAAAFAFVVATYVVTG